MSKNVIQIEMTGREFDMNNTIRNKRCMNVLLCIFTIFILFSTVLTVQAQGADEQIVINSADWMDVYSAMNYANLNGIESNFLISPEHGITLSSVLDTSIPVHLIQSSNEPITPGYENYLESKGFTISVVTYSESGKQLNADLAEEIDTQKFIIIDDSYGYNAISVASYSIASGSWVLFADKNSIDDVYAFLNERNVEELIIYGHTDRVVRERLSEFDPEIIDNKDRFEDNIAIVEKFMGLGSFDQLALTNGEFIEDEIMSGRGPVIFIGRDIIPEIVVEFVRSSGIKAGVVVGNDLIGAASELKDQTNISIFIKFAQGRTSTGGMVPPEALDMFLLPRYQLTLDVVSVQYNEATKQLEVVYRNDGEIGEYTKSTIEIFADGASIATVGDEVPQYIDGSGDSGRVYNIDLTDNARVNDLTIQISTLFGESPNSLNLLLKKTLDVSIISVIDNSKIEASDLRYDVKTERLKITIKNTGDVPCYVSPVVTMLIEGAEEMIYFDNPVSLAVGKKVTAYQRIDIIDADLADNPDAKVRVNYGERSSLLVKNLNETLPLKVIETGLVTYIALLAIIILLGIIVLSRRKKGTTVCVSCSAPLPQNAKFCLKCGSQVEAESNDE